MVLIEPNIPTDSIDVERVPGKRKAKYVPEPNLPDAAARLLKLDPKKASHMNGWMNTISTTNGFRNTLRISRT
jgi:hypothetical protein